ncbi:hypothetical protein MRX96_052697, partial [Rhipicephalus microplus]
MEGAPKDPAQPVKVPMIYICGECHQENEIRPQRSHSLQGVWLQDHVQETYQA